MSRVYMIAYRCLLARLMVPAACSPSQPYLCTAQLMLLLIAATNYPKDPALAVAWQFVDLLLQAKQ